VLLIVSYPAIYILNFKLLGMSKDSDDEELLTEAEDGKLISKRAEMLEQLATW